jgi:prepilin-type processing-associated H-X9-DG protein
MELLIAMLCLALAATLFLPMVARSRNRCCKANCTNNLKQIGLSFRTWALDNNDRYPMQVSVTNGGTMELIPSGAVFIHFEAMSNELSTPKVLICPEDQKRHSGAYFGGGLGDLNLSYFIGVDTQQNYPNMFLAGDRNLTNGLPLTNNILILTQFRPGGWTGELHDRRGNVALADGSVQEITNSGSTRALSITSTVTNRLELP